MRPVDLGTLSMQPFRLLDQQWGLLVAGVERPNPMTVAWGGFGTLWNRPVLTVFVRPTRFTFELLARDPFFTLSFLPDEWRDTLELCGTRSGRDTDKWAASGLVPEPSETIPVPRAAQAELAFECRVLATVDLDPKGFNDPSLEDLYPVSDYHRVYFGHVLAAWQK
jgi:flavin reductase (DIM6/NTAB) family NADH-FMN oxidoreductase RutF